MLNKICIQGRLTRDPQKINTASGISGAAFTLACERDYAPPGHELEVDFLDFVARKSVADFVLKHCTKGRMFTVEGRLEINTWIADDGSKRKNPQIVANRVYFADSKPKQGDADDSAYTTQAEAGFSAVEDAGLPF